MGLGSWFGRTLFRFNWPRFYRTEPQRPSSVNARQEMPWLSELIRTYAGAFPLRWSSGQSNITRETAEIRESYRLALIEPTVKATLIAKVLNVAQLELTCLPASKSSRWDKHIADFVATALKRCKGGVPQIVWNIAAAGLVDGWSLNEKVPAIGDQGILKGRWTIAAFKSKDTKFVHPITDNFRNVIGYQATQANQGYYLDKKDFVHFNYMSFFENPTGLSDLRAANRGIQCKVAAIRLRMMFLERYTGPWMKGVYADTTMRAELEAGLAAARASGYITIPAGTEVELLNLAMSGTSDFQAAIADFDKEIAVAISGAHLQVMEGISQNSAGDTSVHKDAAELFVWYLSDLVRQCIQEQMVPDLVVPNFGTDVDFPDVQLSAVNPKDIVNELAIDEALQRLGLDLSKEDIYDRANRAPGKDAQDTLSPPNKQQVQGGFDPQAQPQPQMGFAEGGMAYLPSPRKPKPVATAVPNPEQDRVDELLGGHVEAGRETLARILAGVLSRGKPYRLSGEESADLADSLGRTAASSELAGRFRASEDSEDSPFEVFAERSLYPQSPDASLDYFRSLSPAIDLDPQGFPERVRREATAHASAVERDLLGRLSGIDGEVRPEEIAGILDETGVTDRDPHYAYQVFGELASRSYNLGLLAQAGDREGLPLHTFADRSHLVKKVITNKLGHRQVVYVRPGETKPGEEGNLAPIDDEGGRVPAREALKKLVANPEAATHLDPKQLTEMLSTLSHRELQNYARQLEAKIGGRKAELADRLARLAIGEKRGESQASPKSAEEAAIAHELEASKSNRELGAIIDPSGKVVARPEQTGEGTELTLSDDEERQARGKTLSHNHPKGTAPSVGDFLNASRLGLAQMRVTVRDGERVKTYSIAPNGEWPDQAAILAAADEASREALRRTDAQVASGKLADKGDSRKFLALETARLLAGKLGLSFVEYDHSTGEKREISYSREENQKDPYANVAFPKPGEGSVEIQTPSDKVEAWTGPSGRRYLYDPSRRPSERTLVSVNGGSFNPVSGPEYFRDTGSAVEAKLEQEMFRPEPKKGVEKPAANKPAIPPGSEQVSIQPGGAIVAKDKSGDLDTIFPEGMGKAVLSDADKRAKLLDALKTAPLYTDRLGQNTGSLPSIVGEAERAGLSRSEVLAGIKQMIDDRLLAPQVLNDTHLLTGDDRSVPSLDRKNLADATLWDKGRAMNWFYPLDDKGAMGSYDGLGEATENKYGGGKS